jgi:glutamine synthetase
MYELGKDIEGYKQLPKNLLDALRLLEGSDVLRERLGDNLIDAYIKLKHSQWNDYSAHLSQWERDNTLDC